MEQLDFINYMFNTQSAQDNFGCTITLFSDDNNNLVSTLGINIKTTDMSYHYTMNSTEITSTQLRELADKIDASITAAKAKIAALVAASSNSTSTTLEQ